MYATTAAKTLHLVTPPSLCVTTYLYCTPAYTTAAGKKLYIYRRRHEIASICVSLPVFNYSGSTNVYLYFYCPRR